MNIIMSTQEATNSGDVGPCSLMLRLTLSRYLLTGSVYLLNLIARLELITGLADQYNPSPNHLPSSANKAGP